MAARKIRGVCVIVGARLCAQRGELFVERHLLKRQNLHVQLQKHARGNKYARKYAQVRQARSVSFEEEEEKIALSRKKEQASLSSSFWCLFPHARVGGFTPTTAYFVEELSF